jgi:RNA recognition motif-containing protein
MTNIFISGIPPKTEEIELVKLFVPFARVNTIQIACDKRTGKPKGFAFIELHDQAEALEAVANLDGTSFGDSTLTVKIAEEKAQRQPVKRPPAAGKYFTKGNSQESLKAKRPRIQRP